MPAIAGEGINGPTILPIAQRFAVLRCWECLSSQAGKNIGALKHRGFLGCTGDAAKKAPHRDRVRGGDEFAAGSR